MKSSKFPSFPSTLCKPHISAREYPKLYQQSITQPEKFWAKIARQELDWFKTWKKVRQGIAPYYQWFAGAKLNITYNCLDRHVAQGLGNKLAYIYNNELNQEQKITYRQLLDLVNQCANGLKSLGVSKGDRVVLYMPLTIEQIALMLACARLGAIHSVVYAGFSSQALKIRVEDTQAKIICTTTWTQRKGKRILLRSAVTQAISKLKFVKKVVVMPRPGDKIKLGPGEISFANLISNQPTTCSPRQMNSQDPLFILYTSGTTGKPKGIVHATAGYNLYTHYTTKINFNLHPNDTVWCTADTGWITGHSYIVYGPLSNGATSVIYEGSPIYPDPGRWWQLIEKYAVTVFYTAPTTIRLLMREGVEFPKRYNLSSLKIVGSVGEPINPAAWLWYYSHIARKKAVVIDTWWQTETGGHIIVSLPSLPQKPGKAGKPFLGIKPGLVDHYGNLITRPYVTGHLVIHSPWPSALTACWRDEDRFKQYWTEYPNKNFFYTGDLAQVDKDGYFIILGRADDVINVSGIRIGTAEVESALVSHPQVVEAAVFGVTDKIKGEAIHAQVVLAQNVKWSSNLEKKLKLHVKKQIGYLAVPSQIKSVASLPKTRSGKIMRRVLKAKELGLPIGDTSTLET